MSYKVEILKKSIENNQIRVWAKFTKGQKSIEQDFVAPHPTLIKDTLRRIALSFEQLDDEMSVPVGEVDLSVSNPIPDLDKDTFMDNFHKLRKVNELISLGVLTGNEPFITSLKNSAKTKFKTEYLDEI